MAKITQKRRGRALKVIKNIRKPGQDVDMDADETKEQAQPISGHSLFKQQAGEWREMKSTVAKLKEQRKKLGKKERESKKKINKEIKALIADMRAKHDKELADAGLVRAPGSSDDMIMSDDE